MAAEDTVKKLADAINRHDVNAFAALFTPDAVIRDPATPQPLKGRDAIRQNGDGWFKAFPDVQFKVSNSIAKGDTVAIEVVMTGTHKGPLTGPAGTIPPTNRRMEIRGVGFLRINAQGLIAEERRYYDTVSLMQQLGLMPGS